MFFFNHTLAHNKKEIKLLKNNNYKYQMEHIPFLYIYTYVYPSYYNFVQMSINW